jgi:hypothetical protein
VNGQRLVLLLFGVIDELVDGGAYLVFVAKAFVWWDIVARGRFRSFSTVVMSCRVGVLYRVCITSTSWRAVREDMPARVAC